MQTFIWLGIIVILGIIAFVVFQNYQQPPVAREAQVVKKHQHRVMTGSVTSKSKYKVTFELTNGRRIEFIVNPKQYELLQEGDRGMLFSRGKRYKGFDRI